MTITTVDAQRRLSVGETFPIGATLDFKMPDPTRFILFEDPEGKLTVGTRGLVSLSKLKLQAGDRYSRSEVRPGVLGFKRVKEQSTPLDTGASAVLERLDRIIELLELQNKQ